MNTNINQSSADHKSDPTTVVEGTTTFVDDAKVVSGTIQMPVQVPSGVSNLVDNNLEKSIRSYLERPIIVQDGNLQSTDIATTFSKIDCLLLAKTNSIWQNKLDGFLGFKADVEFTIVVNATRFQQGRYMLCFLPSCGGVSKYTNHDLMWDSLHEANLTTRTQLHRVEFDVNCDTTAKLVVPYTSVLPCYPLYSTPTSTSYDIGKVRLYPYVAMNTTCTYTIYARFRNIEFFGAALPQAGRMTKGGKSVQEAERADADIGPISGTLRKVSLAAGELGRIPLLSSVTTPVSFVTDILANAAQIFGWSKPNAIQPHHVILKDRARYATTYDGGSTAIPMSMSVKNELQQVGLCTDQDEMSWDYLKTIPAFYRSFAFDTEAAQESLLDSFDLGYAMTVSHTYGTQATVTHLPCTLPSIYFTKFRGGFVITLKCVKTEFHSGRVMMSVVPYTGLQTNVPAFSIASSPYLHRAIIDIREGNEWSFEVPYQSITQWRSGGDTYADLAQIRFDVVDKLVAPASVSSSITFLVEISGAPDLEYAQPRNTTYQPLAPAVIQSGHCIKHSGTVGSFVPAVESTAPTAYCIGEKFTSFRQLLKRDCVMSTANTITPVLDYMVALPFATTTNVAVAAGGSGVTMSMDPYTHLGMMFGMVRGSVRLKVLSTNDTTQTEKGGLGYVTALAGGTDTNIMYRTLATDYRGGTKPESVGSHLLAYTENDSNLAQAIVQIPGYYNNPAASTKDLITTTFATYDAAYPSSNSTAPQVAFNYRFYSKDNNAPTLVRSGADDMGFQCFISTVPLMLGPGNMGTF